MKSRDDLGLGLQIFFIVVILNVSFFFFFAKILNVSCCMMNIEPPRIQDLQDQYPTLGTNGDLLANGSLILKSVLNQRSISERIEKSNHCSILSTSLIWREEPFIRRH